MDDIEGRLIKNHEVMPGYYLLSVKLSHPMDPFTPGQFVMLGIPDSGIFLRRPFSIYDYSRGTLTLMYKVVGKGTEALSKAKKHERIFVLCPLGTGFALGKRDDYVVVAGGIGIAGVHALIKRLGSRASVFFGCTGKDELPLLSDIPVPGLSVSCLDGSFGFPGHVIQLLSRHLKRFKGRDIEIFACGPEKMLGSLKKVIAKERFPCQVLLEERMACGLGLCFGCVKKTVDEEEPYKRVCKEGPVFDLWQICL
jgi:dihydroorotate dehydrogenase electron transfer subunit